MAISKIVGLIVLLFFIDIGFVLRILNEIHCIVMNFDKLENEWA